MFFNYVFVCFDLVGRTPPRPAPRLINVHYDGIIFGLFRVLSPKGDDLLVDLSNYGQPAHAQHIYLPYYQGQILLSSKFSRFTLTFFFISITFHSGFIGPVFFVYVMGRALGRGGNAGKCFSFAAVARMLPLA